MERLTRSVPRGLGPGNAVRCSTLGQRVWRSQTSTPSLADRFGGIRLRYLLLGALLGGLLATAPPGALAFDYAEPIVPPTFGGPGTTVIIVDSTAVPLASAQSVPNEPPFVPHGTWDDAEGGG